MSELNDRVAKLEAQMEQFTVLMKNPKQMDKQMREIIEHIQKSIGSIENKKFDNGNIIFNAENEPIDPKSKDGKIIQDILNRQRLDKKLNDEQRAKWEEITGQKIEGKD